ncbi:MAG: hypothetical protein ACRCXB_28215 [Aeromonadaceae bacterium]
MIDLDEIESEVGNGNDDEMLAFTRGEMLELITRLRQAEKDAARYRWLRDESNYCGAIGPLVFLTDANGSFCMDECQCKISLIEDSLDAVVDEAMNGSNN